MGSEIEWPATRVRDTFIKCFQEKDHVNWKSSPVVPHNDPSLLFVNAGMNQFKPLFLGTVDPNTQLSKLTRACNSQKCLRAGGKHNDLDDVGQDTYHHTFFEMLGNWSFGDYGKAKAIEWAWELLTKVYGLPQEQIYVTYFGGDERFGIASAADNESKELWLKYLPPDRVLPFGCKDNFWEMGDTGPCGPCTEIHFDRIGKVDRIDNCDVASLVNEGDPTVIEIWNLVFIEFNRESDGSVKALPAKHIDTGMGLERLTSILQKKMSNYDTDLFTPILNAIKVVTEAEPYSGKVGPDDVKQVDMAYRVVADHIRALSVAIADGCYPDSGGREFVLRRILRRAVRYGTQVLRDKVLKAEILKDDKGFFSGLVKVVVEAMGNVFPELKLHEKLIMDTIASEEKSFRRTFIKGSARFDKTVEDLYKKKVSGQDAILSGQDAYLLWDTYGFPLDLTQLMAKEKGFTVDVDGFNKAMNESRERSRNAQSKPAGKTIAMDTDADATSVLQNQVIKAKKKTTEESMQKAIKNVSEKTETACSVRKGYCIARVSVGSDNAAIREAVVRVMEEKGIAVMAFSTDEKKCFVCAGVPSESERSKKLNVLEWLKIALNPLNGKGGGGKSGLAQGQGSVISNVEEAMNEAETYAYQELN